MLADQPFTLPRFLGQSSLNPTDMPQQGSGKPRLLFLAQTLPYPPDGGVQIRTFNVLRLLSSRFDIHALCFYRRASHSTPDRVARALHGLNQFARVEAFPIPEEYSRIRLLLDHLASVSARRVYTATAYRCARFRARVNELVSRGGFDLVYLDSMDLSTYLPLVSVRPVVCTHHNIESALLRRRAMYETNPLRRSYLRFQSRLMAREEARWAPQVDLNIVVSLDDRRRLAEIAPNASAVVVPNGVDTEALRPIEGSQHGIVFVGGYTWFPNRDALSFFAREVLPLIRNGTPDNPVIRWVGRAPPAVVEHYRDAYGIELTGYVESIKPYLAEAACYVVPLRVGGGTRLKILDAWAMGKAVVSTAAGCEGLEAIDGENILIRDDPAAFAAAVRLVLSDPDLRCRLGDAARRTAEDRYDWRVIGRTLIPSLESLITTRS